MANVSGLTGPLLGRVIASQSSPGVSYRLEHRLGEGGMGVAFFATREAPDGVTPVVLKVVKPEIVGTAGATALLMIQKEAIALGRLNERVPPTPFVVRFLDTGIVEMSGHRPIELPWIALEYVHGGAEGTTLEQRTLYSIQHTRYGFDPARAAHHVECLAEGLTAIHEVGVVHRDVTPGNVLCCGFGASEVPKIADFGIARPVGVQATFGSVLLGTPGYGAPEQSFSSGGDVGPWTDVFSFACLLYFILTGEQLFDTANYGQALLLVRDEKRRSVRDAPALTPELRHDVFACHTLDAAIARATQLSPAARPPTAHLFASSILPVLRAAGGPRSQRASERLVASVAQLPASATPTGWVWTVRHPPGDDRLVRSVAWDGDGHCLALTTGGLCFWNGTSWLPARVGGMNPSAALRSVSLVRPGQWLLGGDGGLLAVIGTDGVHRMIQGPTDADLSLASGDPDDLALVVAESSSGPPLLYTVAAGRFFRPLPLEAARTVAAISRIDDVRWLVAGRTTQGSGLAALYSALGFEGTFLLTPPTDALTTCGAHVDRGLGVAAGRRGATVRFDGRVGDAAVVDGNPDLACSAMDVQGRAWVGAAGRLWSQSPGTRMPWQCAWEAPSWRTPFVSLRADVGVINAMTVDGAVLEGRAAS